MPGPAVEAVVTVDGGAKPVEATVHGGNPIQAVVSGGKPLQALVGNVAGQSLAATIEGPSGQPINAKVEATVHGGGAPLEARVELGRVQVAPINLVLQPGIKIEFFLFGFSWLRLFSITVKGNANLS